MTSTKPSLVFSDGLHKSVAGFSRSQPFCLPYSENILGFGKYRQPEMLLEEKQLQEQVYAAVMRLPEKQAKRVYARYYLGMTVNEIAEVEGVDPSRVRDSIRRGLKQLVKYF